MSIMSSECNGIFIFPFVVKLNIFADVHFVNILLLFHIFIMDNIMWYYLQIRYLINVLTHG